METQEILNSMSLFSGLSGTQMQTLQRAARKLRFDKMQTVLHTGELPDAFYYVLSGHLKRASAAGSSQEKVLDLIFPGQSFAEAELLAQRPSISDVIAVEQSTLLCIDAQVLRKLTEAAPALALRLLHSLAQRQVDLETDVLASRALNGSQRTLDYLILQAGGLSGTRGETRLLLPTSKQLIAARLGLTPETFSRSLRELTEAGLIVVDTRHILLQNEAISHSLEQNSLNSRASTLNHAVLPSDTRLQHQDLRSVTNQAGRLRALSQRMAKFWLMLGKNIQPQRARNLLQQSIQEFEQQFARLSTRLDSKKTRKAHDAVLKLWEPYKLLLASPSTPENVRKLFNLNEKVLQAAHQLTLAFEDSPPVRHNQEGQLTQLITLAGRSRLLSQRMAKLYMFMEWKQFGINSNQCQDELQSAMEEFENALSQLLEEVRAYPKIRNQIEHALQQWQLMRTALSGSSADNQNRLSATVCTFSERLLKKMDTAIALYEKKVA